MALSLICKKYLILPITEFFLQSLNIMVSMKNYIASYDLFLHTGSNTCIYKWVLLLLLSPYYFLCILTTCKMTFHWLRSKKPSLNEAKTELIIFDNHNFFENQLIYSYLLKATALVVMPKKVLNAHKFCFL